MRSDRAGLEDKEAIAYIRQMLGELHQVARQEGADMLCYLIEMAYLEVHDIIQGERPLSVREEKRHGAA